MIYAVKSTLEESLAADLILLLIDCSEDETEDIRIKYSGCQDVLDELPPQVELARSKVFVILSKFDCPQPERIDVIANALRISNPIVISLHVVCSIIILDMSDSRNATQQIMA
jgi:50S ribosomal subunit-associated GTPase HflX